MRLAKYLARAGVASRRAAEKLIAAGDVTVNDTVVTDPARDVDGSESIVVQGKSVTGPELPITYILNKPEDVVSTAKDTHGRRVVTDLVRSNVRLYPVGRLDADTTGLILLTNDGELAYRLTHPRYEVPKTYRAWVWGGEVSEEALEQLRNGVEIEEGMTAPAKVTQLRPALLEITIHEGRKRQVKRMCDAVGHRVRKLTRVQFGPLELGDLASGQCRRLDDKDIQALRDAAGL